MILGGYETGSLPLMMCGSEPHIAVYSTLILTSSGPTSCSGISSISRTFFFFHIAALITDPPLTHQIARQLRFGASRHRRGMQLQKIFLICLLQRRHHITITAFRRPRACPPQDVSYTHLTLPTNREE